MSAVDILIPHAAPHTACDKKLGGAGNEAGNEAGRAFRACRATAMT